MELSNALDDTPRFDPRSLLAADGAKICGARCACHGGVVCRRAPHPHGVDDAQPHLGPADDGELVQWTHTDDDGPLLSDEQAAEVLKAARRQHTRVLLEGLDLDELRAILAGATPTADHAAEGA